jgi:hypothetical protein
MKALNGFDRGIGGLLSFTTFGATLLALALPTTFTALAFKIGFEGFLGFAAVFFLLAGLDLLETRCFNLELVFAINLFQYCKNGREFLVL